MTTTKKQRQGREFRERLTKMWETPTWLTSAKTGETAMIGVDYGAGEDATAVAFQQAAGRTRRYRSKGFNFGIPSGMSPLGQMNREGSTHFTGVGSTMRLGHVRLDHSVVGTLYREFRFALIEQRVRDRQGLRAGEFLGGRWVRVCGLPSWRGIGNRHDRKRWIKRELAPVVAVANDALLEGDRRRAVLALCEVMSLSDALAWTRRERTLADEMMEFQSRRDDVHLTRSIARATELHRAFDASHPQVAEYQAWQTARQAEGVRLHRNLARQIHGTHLDLVIVNDPHAD